MKRLIGIVGMMAGFIFLTSSEVINYPSVTNKAFQVGEKLRFRVTYGFVDAGEAILEVKSTSKKGGDRELLQVIGTGRTLGGFNSVFKVNDKYESYIDKKSLFPWFFSRRVDEGGYKINQDYTFHQDQNKVNNGAGKEFKTTMGVQDMISSFYYARTLNFNGIKKNDVYEFKCFMDDEHFNLKIKYVGDELIHLRKGKFNCMKFVPVVQTGRYFKSENDVNFWVTKDENHIPLYVKAKIPVGVVKLQLVEWEGLKNELSSKVK